MANIAIGEAAIYVDGQEVILRPSFANMQKIGSPEEIKEILWDCFNSLQKQQAGLELHYSDILPCSIVFDACGGDEIESRIFGQMSAPDADKLEWIAGIEPIDNLIVMANHLLSWGINGKPSKGRLRKAANEKDGKEYLFDPLEFVGAAVAHLGMNTADAWNLTMVEFQRIMDSKYPPIDPKKEKHYMTADELRELKQRVGKNKPAKQR
jgi:hypothetical protein